MALQRTLLDASVASFAALLVVPVLGALPVPATEPMAAGAGAGVFAVAFAGATSADGLPGVVDGVEGLVSVVVPPSLAGVRLVDALSTTGEVVVPLLVGTLAVIPGVAALVLAHECELARRTAAATELVRFRAPPAERSRMLLLVGTGLFGAAALLFVAVGALRGGGTTLVAVVPAVSSAVVTATVTARRTREIRVTDRGVRTARVFQNWDDLAGFAVADGDLLLSRAGYLPVIAYDLSDVDDVAGIEDALAEHLPRRDP